MVLFMSIIGTTWFDKLTMACSPLCHLKRSAELTPKAHHDCHAKLSKNQKVLCYHDI